MADRDEKEQDRSGDSAGQKAHGTHGRGVGGREEREDAANPQPEVSRGFEEEMRGNSGWGDAGSGTSSIDRRPPENK